MQDGCLWLQDNKFTRSIYKCLTASASGLFVVVRGFRRETSLPPALVKDARKLKKLVELPLHGAWDWLKVRLMKGKVSSTSGIYRPIIPKRGDRQVCLITCSLES